MRLIARVIEVHRASATTAPDTLAYLTPVHSGLLLSLVIRTGDLRLVAGLLASHDRAAASEPVLYQQLRSLVEQYYQGQPGVGLIEGHLRSAADTLNHRVRRKRPEQAALSVRQLRIATGLLGSEWQSRVPISLVAMRCGISESHLRRGFHASTGMSPGKWRLEQRLTHCRRQLLETDLPLSQISTQSGFPMQNYFSRVFTRVSGITPSDWRRLFKGALKGFTAIREPSISSNHRRL